MNKQLTNQRSTQRLHRLVRDVVVPHDERLQSGAQILVAQSIADVSQTNVLNYEKPVYLLCNMDYVHNVEQRENLHVSI